MPGTGEPSALALESSWTWWSGSDTVNQPGSYGSRGQESAASVPGARDGGATWVDAAGNLWLFGGYGKAETGEGALNDLWRFNRSTKRWAWLGGARIANSSGAYCIGGDGCGTELWPGARWDAFAWTDGSGNLWLFGGAYAGDQRWSDLWRFSTATSTWTLVSGTEAKNESATYGTRGVPSGANRPGARAAGVAWTDLQGSFWLFGGEVGGSGSDLRNDLWRRDRATGNWTWISGSNSSGAPGSYGTLRVPAATNVPGARERASGWRDAAGSLWLFGGYGKAETGEGALNDLWRWDVAAQVWTWMHGSSSPDAAGVYGAPGVPAATLTPGARAGAAAVSDASGRGWLFGGVELPLDGCVDCDFLRNDLWRWDGGNWTWIAGSNQLHAAGSYGTKGTPAPTNVPGARSGASAWCDPAGDVWLFGGAAGTYLFGGTNFQNDLWSWDVPAGAPATASLAVARLSCDGATSTSIASGAALFAGDTLRIEPSVAPLHAQSPVLEWRFDYDFHYVYGADDNEAEPRVLHPDLSGAQGPPSSPLALVGPCDPRAGGNPATGSGCWASVTGNGSAGGPDFLPSDSPGTLKYTHLAFWARNAAGSAGTKTFVLNWSLPRVDLLTTTVRHGSETFELFAEGCPVSRRWYFGQVTGGGDSPVLEPACTTASCSHAFPAPGIYSYRLEAAYRTGYVSVDTGTVTVVPASEPPAVTFTATPATITAGQSSTLAWTVTNATSATIDGGVGTVALPSGTRVVGPTTTTTYTLTATGPGGSSTRTVTVTVNPACSAPNAPTGPALRPRFSSAGPVTGTDPLSATWGPPSGGTPPIAYEYRVNGDAYQRVGTQLGAEVAPRGANGDQPIQLFVRAAACAPEQTGAVAQSPAYPLSPPVADFDAPAEATVLQPVVFTDRSAQATSWLWIVDEGGSPGTQQSFSHTFQTTGTHTVALLASNGNGTSMRTRTINVRPGSSNVVANARRERRLEPGDPDRLYLAGLELTPPGPALLRLAPSGSEAVVCYLRVLDPDGGVLRERRLVPAAGAESAYDLKAWTAADRIDLDLACSGTVQAAVEQERSRVPEPRERE
jgi:PKD repeat protein